MRLKTKRLVIRDVYIDDAKDFLQMNLNDNVMKYISSKARIKSTIEKEIEKIKKWQFFYEEHNNFGLWTITLNTEVIGWICLRFNHACNEHELGYRFKEKYWGSGYATESCKAVINYGFSLEGVGKIIAVAIKTNVASVKVMKNIGMKYDREDHLYKEDVVVYSILNR